MQSIIKNWWYQHNKSPSENLEQLSTDANIYPRHFGESVDDTKLVMQSEQNRKLESSSPYSLTKPGLLHEAEFFYNNCFFLCFFAIML